MFYKASKKIRRQIPFEKSLLLTRLGEIMFSMALRLGKADLVHANDPYPCIGGAFCSGCNAYDATQPCTGCNSVDIGCSSAHGEDWGQENNCWYSYIAPYVYACCDWDQGGTFCICRSSHYAGYNA